MKVFDYYNDISLYDNEKNVCKNLLRDSKIIWNGRKSIIVDEDEKRFLRLISKYLNLHYELKRDNDERLMANVKFEYLLIFLFALGIIPFQIFVIYGRIGYYWMIPLGGIISVLCIFEFIYYEMIHFHRLSYMRHIQYLIYVTQIISFINLLATLLQLLSIITHLPLIPLVYEQPFPRVYENKMTKLSLYFKLPMIIMKIGIAVCHNCIERQLHQKFYKEFYEKFERMWKEFSHELELSNFPLLRILKNLKKMGTRSKIRRNRINRNNNQMTLGDDERLMDDIGKLSNLIDNVARKKVNDGPNNDDDLITLSESTIDEICRLNEKIHRKYQTKGLTSSNNSRLLRRRNRPIVSLRPKTKETDRDTVDILKDYIDRNDIIPELSSVLSTAFHAHKSQEYGSGEGKKGKRNSYSNRSNSVERNHEFCNTIDDAVERQSNGSTNYEYSPSPNNQSPSYSPDKFERESAENDENAVNFEQSNDTIVFTTNDYHQSPPNPDYNFESEFNVNVGNSDLDLTQMAKTKRLRTQSKESSKRSSNRSQGHMSVSPVTTVSSESAEQQQQQQRSQVYAMNGYIADERFGQANDKRNLNEFFNATFGKNNRQSHQVAAKSIEKEVKELRETTARQQYVLGSNNCKSRSKTNVVDLNLETQSIAKKKVTIKEPMEKEKKKSFSNFLYVIFLKICVFASYLPPILLWNIFRKKDNKLNEPTERVRNVQRNSFRRTFISFLRHMSKLILIGIVLLYYCRFIFYMVPSPKIYGKRLW
ncbi:hypothetical protein SNEBB_005657 [Seison nebaliae]|nr:hypothetical protein SNEBB_005657 [Seison nebaliae]